MKQPIIDFSRLENDQVKLECLAPKHLEFLLPIAMNEPHLLTFSPSAFGSENALKQYIASALQAKKEGTRAPFVIFDKLRRKYVGSTSYGNISTYHQRLEIGWTWITKEVQGTGLNAACKSLLLNYAFNELAMERVEFRIDERNIRSRKAVEKLGATLEGILRSHTLMQDGYRRNTCYYSILRYEFVKLTS